MLPAPLAIAARAFGDRDWPPSKYNLATPLKRKLKTLSNRTSVQD